MGIQNNTFICLMSTIKKYNIDCSELLTIGRQNLSLNKKTAKYVMKYFNHINCKELELKTLLKKKYADEIINKLLGSRPKSLDVSAYEKADLIFNLNFPIKLKDKKQYSCIFDGGSSEHIFNIKQVFENYNLLLADGGYIIHVLPTNGQNGHGMYQFSPEFFSSVYSTDNGFEILEMFFLKYVNEKKVWKVINKPSWRLIYNPVTPTNIFVVAKKNNKKNSFDFIPQQSDYEKMWQGETFSGKYNKIKKIIPKKYYMYLYQWIILPLRNRKYIKKLSIKKLFDSI